MGIQSSKPTVQSKSPLNHFQWLLHRSSRLATVAHWDRGEFSSGLRDLIVGGIKCPGRWLPALLQCTSLLTLHLPDPTTPCPGRETQVILPARCTNFSSSLHDLHDACPILGHDLICFCSSARHKSLIAHSLLPGNEHSAVNLSWYQIACVLSFFL